MNTCMENMEMRSKVKRGDPRARDGTPGKCGPPGITRNCGPPNGPGRRIYRQFLEIGDSGGAYG